MAFHEFLSAQTLGIFPLHKFIQSKADSTLIVSHATHWVTSRHTCYSARKEIHFTKVPGTWELTFSLASPTKRKPGVKTYIKPKA